MITAKDRFEHFKNNVDTIDTNGNYIADPLFQYSPIRRNGADIYFYADVDKYSQLVLFQLLNDAQMEISSMQHMNKSPFSQPIKIHINSLGGELQAGFAIYDYIKNMEIETIGIVEGMAASAASLILLACDRRVMGDNSSVLLHQCSGGLLGNYSEIIDEKDNMDKAMVKLETIYLEETKIGITDEMEEKLHKYANSPNPLEFDEYFNEIFDSRLEDLIGLLKHDYELDKDECVSLGIIDDEHANEEVELTDEDQDAINEYIQKIIKKRINEDKKAEKELMEQFEKDLEEKSKPKKKSTTTKKKTTKKK